jgi:hypothetical protein
LKPTLVEIKLRDGLVKLVGERPLLKCRVGEAEVEALWDTGAMVSIVSEGWLRQKCPDTPVLTVQEFLEGDDLHLCAANNTSVDIGGVVILNFKLGNLSVNIPFLVSRDELSGPILGYNLIKHLVEQDVEELPSLLRESIPSLETDARAEAVVAFIQNDGDQEEEVAVKRKTIIPAKLQVQSEVLH